MVHGPLFLAPVFQERIWGGTALHDRFGYDIPSDHTGECWGISAHHNGPSRICNGELAGKSLNEVWEQHPELFGRAGIPTQEPFPLLVKILDANEDLSVQVHPDDAYAAEHEQGEFGKTECWYVLDCAPEAELILGHTAATREELAERMARGEWEELLVRRKIRPGQFFYVPSGTVHALGKGTLVLEVQQSSDTTYRVYDYDRTDASGNKRELHVTKALDVTTVPHADADVNRRVINSGDDYTVTCLVEAEYFSTYHVLVQASGEYHGTQTGSYLLASVVAGNGTFATGDGEWKLTCGDHFLIPATVETFYIRGNVELILAKANGN